jgi:hypothetical protein
LHAADKRLLPEGSAAFFAPADEGSEQTGVAEVGQELLTLGLALFSGGALPQGIGKMVA